VWDRYPDVTGVNRQSSLHNFLDKVIFSHQKNSNCKSRLGSGFVYFFTRILKLLKAPINSNRLCQSFKMSGC